MFFSLYEKRGDQEMKHTKIRATIISNPSLHIEEERTNNN